MVMFNKQKMSTEKVLQNLHYYFVHIFQNAESREDWDHDSVAKALEWADYCSEIYKRSCNKPFERQFDELIRQMFNLDKKWKGKEVTLTMLQNAPNLLCQVLLRNKSLSWQLKSTVLNSYLTHGDKDTVNKELADIVMCVAGTNIHHELNPDVSITPIINMKSLVEKLHTVREHDTNLEIQNEISAIATQNMTALLEFAINEDNKITPSDAELILEWIENNFWKYESDLITKQSPHMLTQIARKSEVFLLCYLRFLENEVGKLKPIYRKTDHFWKTSENSSCTFDIIIHHFSSLCEKSDQVRNLAEKMLINKVLDGESSIWFDIQMGIIPS